MAECGQHPRPLSQCLSALTAPPKWEPLAVHANFISMPRPLPLGEVDLRSKDEEGELAGKKASTVDICCSYFAQKAPEHPQTLRGLV